MSGSILLPLALILKAASFGLGAGAPQEQSNPSFDFEGVDAFWAIVSVLESDREPTESEWDAFFEAPGYARLTEEFGRGYFQKALQGVFMPSRSHLADEMVGDYQERGGFLGWYTPMVLDGFREASRDREWLRGRVEELKSYPYLERAADLALEYLPETTAGEYPAVQFVVFSDSRGSSPLIMGLAGNDAPSPAEEECFAGQGQDRHWPFVLLLAHESFHLYRDKVQEVEIPESGNPDYAILWTLDQMENEGIGDLIHRKRLYYGEGCQAGSGQALVMQREQLAQPATIRIMDQIFSELADDPGLAGTLGAQFQGFIPQSGHPTGLYMANVIEEELGAEALKEVVRNPFRFFALYNRAAEMNGSAPVLSSGAMAYLESLEERYTKG